MFRGRTTERAGLASEQKLTVTKAVSPLCASATLSGRSIQEQQEAKDRSRHRRETSLPRMSSSGAGIVRASRAGTITAKAQVPLCIPPAIELLSSQPSCGTEKQNVSDVSKTTQTALLTCCSLAMSLGDSLEPDAGSNAAETLRRALKLASKSGSCIARPFLGSTSLIVSKLCAGKINGVSRTRILDAEVSVGQN